MTNFDGYEPVAIPAPDEAVERDTYTRMLERLAGQQISRYRKFDERRTNNPWGGATVGFEFRSHERAVFWARPVPAGLQSTLGVCAGIMPVLFPPQSIITPRMERYVTSDRPSTDYAPEEWHWVEGTVIRDATVLDTANRYGGQSIDLDFGQDGHLLIHAAPGNAHGARRTDGRLSKFTANLELEPVRPVRTRIWLP